MHNPSPLPLITSGTNRRHCSAVPPLPQKRRKPRRCPPAADPLLLHFRAFSALVLAPIITTCAPVNSNVCRFSSTTFDLGFEDKPLRGWQYFREYCPVTVLLIFGTAQPSQMRPLSKPLQEGAPQGPQEVLHVSQLQVSQVYLDFGKTKSDGKANGDEEGSGFR